jgi:rod shape-determining protein MreD
VIKKIIINGILIIGVGALTYSRYNRFLPGDVEPDIFLILVVFNGIFNGSFFGMIFGFFSGLMLDILSWPMMGFYSFIYTIIGYSTALVEKRIDIENPLVSSIFITLQYLFKCIIFLFAGLIFLSQGDVANFFKNQFLIQAVYTILLAIPVFLIYRKIYSMRRKIR